MYAVFIIKPDGSITKTEQPKSPSYDQSKAAVGGYIETVPHFTKMEWEGVKYTRGVAYANEEGKVKGLPNNPKARELWHAALKGTGDYDPARTYLNGDIIFYAAIPKPRHIASVS